LKRKPAAKKPAKTKPKQGKKKMAKKLYGAAAAARKKRLAKLKRKRTSSRRKAPKRNPASKRKSSKRVAAGKKAARTRKRNARGKSAVARKRRPVKRRKLRSNPPKGSKKIGGTFRSASWQKRSAAAKKGWRAKKKGKKSTRKVKRTRAQANRYASYGLKGQKKSRKRTLRAKKRKGAWRTRKYMSKHGQLKVNPSGKMGGMMGAMKQVLPVAGAFYVSKVAANKIGDIPAIAGVLSKLNVGGYDLSKPVVSGVLLAAVNYGTKKGKLSKHRTGLMLGAALALVDTLFHTFVPADMKGMIGLNEYVSTGEYVSSGEYVSTGGVITPGHGEPAYNYDDSDPHGLYAVDGLHEVHAIHGIDAELGAIEAGADVGINNGIFANGW
jgi:hypothetical protein